MQTHINNIKALYENTNVTVGEAAARIPAIKPALEKLGIDYCCGGSHNLQAEMQKHGVSIDQLVAAMPQTASDTNDSANRDWTSASLTELIEHILTTHHAYMKRELPRIDGLLAKVTAAHGKRHGQLLNDLTITFHGLREEIEQHLFKEEEILFPMVTAIEAFKSGKAERPVSHCGTVMNPIRQMEHEHENAGAALVYMRQRTDNYRLPDDACMTFGTLYEALDMMEKDLHEHIHLENNILFPAAVALEATTSGA